MLQSETSCVLNQKDLSSDASFRVMMERLDYLENLEVMVNLAAKVN